MFPYTEKYTESESDIQNNNLLYKTHQQCQTTFVFFENVVKLEKIKINIFRKIRSQNDQRFMAIIMYIYIYEYILYLGVKNPG